MILPEYSVSRKPVVIFSMVLLFLGGLYAYNKLGKLEDPEFTIKTATVVTLYPGASPSEVELQVTDEIERVVQELEWLKRVRSISRAGLSIVYVDIEESNRSDTLPQIWDKLRRKIHDVEPLLPPGAQRPAVFDDYGDVFGVFLALTGDGFSFAELHDIARMLQRELLLVKDVNRVMLWGMQRECVYVELSRARLAEMGIHPSRIVETLYRQNLEVEAGKVHAGSERIRIETAGAFESIENIADLVVQGSPPGELVLLRDIARVRRGYIEPPETLMRFNGRPAIGIAISTVSKGNVVVMGDAVKNRLAELMQILPAGIDIGPVAYQANAVKRSIRQFVTNLIESVSIVIGILLITMGMRSGMLIGWALVLAIVGTLIVMLPLGIDLHRSSLGALIIAMGMLVDNAIVVTEGSLIRLQRGDSSRDAAVRPAAATAWPLLGATFIAILAFMPIYLARDDTGEYCESLFLVVAISLALSWIIAMTVTPVLCSLFLRIDKKRVGADPYAGPVYRNYRFVLEKALRNRTGALLIMVGLFCASAFGFGYVKQIFFPDSDRTQFMVEYWLPEGSRIDAVSEDIRKIERHIMEMPGVVNVTSCIGAGSPRFILEYEPQIANTSYGLLLINVPSYEIIPGLSKQIETYLHREFPRAEPRVRSFPLGPATEFKIEARFSGPDPVTLRELSDNAQAIMRSDPQTRDTRDNWRQRVKVLRAGYSQARGRRALVSRPDVGMSLGVATDGVIAGLYREDDELLPVIIRNPEGERHDVENLASAPVRGQGPQSLPLGQVVPELQTVWEDPIIHRWNRRRTITAQTQPLPGITADDVLRRIKGPIEDIALPPGYFLEWGGDLEESVESNASVNAQLPLAFILAAFTIVILFNAFRQPLIILLTLPLALIGITVGLLVTGKPFGFMALLGALSLFGMMIKNAVVLLDQIDTEIRSGTPRYRAVVQSSVSRMRPVMMASFTTVLGMTPLIPDPLFGAMAVTIMSGLSFATVLTLIIVPVLYTIFFRIRPS